MRFEMLPCWLLETFLIFISFLYLFFLKYKHKPANGRGSSVNYSCALLLPRDHGGCALTSRVEEQDNRRISGLTRYGSKWHSFRTHPTYKRKGVTVTTSGPGQVGSRVVFTPGSVYTWLFCCSLRHWTAACTCIQDVCGFFFFFNSFDFD